MKFMKNATLRQLQIFESIARLGSFTAAAKELYLTQPTISMQIKKLSELIEAPLFQVHNKHVMLTDAGKELVPACRAIFRELEKYETVLGNIKEIGQGELSISGVTTTEYFAPRILGDFIHLYPGITASLEVTNRARVIERMQSGVDDLYIIGQSYAEADLETVPFLENPIVFFAAPDHPLAERSNIPVSELLGENIFGREEGSETSLILGDLLESQGALLKSSMRLGSNEAIKLAVKSRLGISMLSQLALTREVESGELVILDVEGFPRMDSWHIAYLKGAHLSAVAEAFFKFLINSREAYTREFLNVRRRNSPAETDRRNKRAKKSKEMMV